MSEEREQIEVLKEQIRQCNDYAVLAELYETFSSKRHRELRDLVRSKMRQIKGYFVVNWQWRNGHQEISVYLKTAELEDLVRNFDDFREMEVKEIQRRVFYSTFIHEPSKTRLPATETIIGRKLNKLCEQGRN